VTAAPTTRKHVSATMVIALVKPYPYPSTNQDHFPDNWALIKAKGRIWAGNLPPGSWIMR
jgi:hypothetical protein